MRVIPLLLLPACASLGGGLGTAPPSIIGSWKLTCTQDGRSGYGDHLDVAADGTTAVRSLESSGDAEWAGVLSTDGTSVQFSGAGDIHAGSHRLPWAIRSGEAATEADGTVVATYTYSDDYGDHAWICTGEAD